MLNPDDEDDEADNSLIQAIYSCSKVYGNKGQNKKIVVLSKGQCLIYIAISTEKDESASFLRK